MYDAVDVSRIPADWTGLVAGYETGAKIPSTLPALRKRFPRNQVVDIAVTAAQDANVADCEKGDLRADQCPAWARRQRARGADPTVYTSLANWPAVKAAFAAAGEPLPWWWCADWDGDPTLPDDPRCVAKQYTNGATPPGAPNRVPGCDTSAVADFWPGVDPTGRYRMLVFAQGLDATTALAVCAARRVGVATTDIAEAKAAIARGDKVLVIGGPAAKALGYTAPTGTPTTWGCATVAIGATADDTLTLATQLIH